MAIEYKDLDEVLGDVDRSAASGYCCQPSGISANQKTFYWDWEAKVAVPRLQALGYKVLCWYDGEVDSFGPLTRVVHVEKLDTEVKSHLIYGVIRTRLP